MKFLYYLPGTINIFLQNSVAVIDLAELHSVVLSLPLLKKAEGENYNLKKNSWVEEGTRRSPMKCYDGQNRLYTGRLVSFIAYC